MRRYGSWALPLILVLMSAGGGWTPGGASEDAAKVSPALLRHAAQGPIRCLVEFRADVPDITMRLIAQRESLIIREHPDLLPGHMMIDAGLPQIQSLVLHAEVAHLRLASHELAKGQPVRGCPGAVLAGRVAGRYIIRVGPGWSRTDSSVELSYSIENEPSSLAAGVFAEEVARALAEWAKWVKIEFSRQGTPSSERHLHFLFAKGDHGDAYPFDGRGKTLAHTFYPAPPNPEPLAGDVHFDEEENWHTEIDIYSVLLHEIGHALGLGHADTPTSIMYPYFTRSSSLTAEDVAAIRDLYPAREEEGASQQ